MDRMERVKELRKELGLWQKQLSKVIGIPVKKINAYETGGLKCPDLYEAKLKKLINERKQNENIEVQRV